MVRKKNESSNSPKAPSALFWLLFGLVLGFSMFTLSFVFIADRDKKLAMQSLQQKMSAKQRQGQGNFYDNKKSLEPIRPQFYDFYEVLKNTFSMDMNSGSDNRPQQPKITKKSPRERPKKQLGQQSPSINDRTLSKITASKHDVTAVKSGYILQVGAFRRQSDADRLRANLTLLGLPCYVQSAKVKSQIYHRVRLGPFQDKARLAKVQARLKANNIDSIAMQIN